MSVIRFLDEKTLYDRDFSCTNAELPKYGILSARVVYNIHTITYEDGVEIDYTSDEMYLRFGYGAEGVWGGTPLWRRLDIKYREEMPCL